MKEFGNMWRIVLTFMALFLVISEYAYAESQNTATSGLDYHCQDNGPESGTGVPLCICEGFADCKAMEDKVCKEPIDKEDCFDGACDCEWKLSRPQDSDKSYTKIDANTESVIATKTQHQILQRQFKSEALRQATKMHGAGLGFSCIGGPEIALPQCRCSGWADCKRMEDKVCKKPIGPDDCFEWDCYCEWKQ